jgi:hypothetical protein
MKYLSKHITMTEATYSKTAKNIGMDNTPSEDQLEAMKHIAQDVFEPLREHFKVPIGISSFFRSDALNRYLHGASGSQHIKGEAMDIDADIYGRVTNAEIFLYILLNLEFDQLIWEFGDDENPNWVHVSYRRDGKNRRQVLRAKKVKGQGGYIAQYKKLTK